MSFIRCGLLYLAVVGFSLSSLPANAQSFVDVAVADFWACGLTDQGEVVCANDINRWAPRPSIRKLLISLARYNNILFVSRL